MAALSASLLLLVLLPFRILPITTAAAPTPTPAATPTPTPAATPAPTPAVAPTPAGMMVIYMYSNDDYHQDAADADDDDDDDDDDNAVIAAGRISLALLRRPNPESSTLNTNP